MAGKAVLKEFRINYSSIKQDCFAFFFLWNNKGSKKYLRRGGEIPKSHRDAI